MEAFVLWHRLAPLAHDDEADSAAAFAWLRHVRSLAEAARATVLGPMGGAIACVFDIDDEIGGLEFALSLMQEAERSPDFAHAPRVAIGIARGELDLGEAAHGRAAEYVGAAIDPGLQDGEIR